jgi:ribosomal protein L11 methyltransferase
MVELLLLAPEDCVENASDALIDELDALSVSVEDADADSDAEQALFDEPGMPAPRPGWQRSVLRALFTDEAQATEAATLLLAQDWAKEVRVQAIQPVEDQDWVRLTQSQFAPVPITPEFWIVPSWHEPPAGATRVIRLDPGLAFGTGTHPTTRMCLRWTALNAPSRSAGWARVLDYGCGSGILAIAAALHGAQAVDAVDIDPRERAGQRRDAERRSAGRGTGQLPAGVRQHPGDAVEAAGAVAVRACRRRRRPRPCRHLGASGQRADGSLRTVARADGQRRRRGLDSDDGTPPVVNRRGMIRP